jgi:hypothetical protein
MKFDDLYNRVIIVEQENTEVAHPDDFNDVEPMPLAEPSLESDEPALAADTQSTSGLTDYIKLTLDFVKKLQDSDGGESLQTLVKRLDFPGSGFEGISSGMSSKILAAVKAVQDVTAEMVSRNIHAAKNNS